MFCFLVSVIGLKFKRYLSAALRNLRAESENKPFFFLQGKDKERFPGELLRYNNWTYFACHHRCKTVLAGLSHCGDTGWRPTRESAFETLSLPFGTFSATLHRRL